MYGLSGASRSGKTTLGKAVAEKLGINFVTCSTSEYARAAGFNPIAPMDLETRLVCQEAILDGYLRMLDTAPRPAITDRTPLDMAAYMLCETTMLIDPKLSERVMAYAKRCLGETERYLDIVIAVPRLSTYKEEADKHPTNLAYAWKHEMLVESLVRELRTTMGACLASTDLAERVALVGSIIAFRQQHHLEARQGQFLH